ncbi:hypothetical protein VPH207E292_0088 [Vibrio phage 207E29-2]
MSLSGIRVIVRNFVTHLTKDTEADRNHPCLGYYPVIGLAGLWG